MPRLAVANLVVSALYLIKPLEKTNKKNKSKRRKDFIIRFSSMLCFILVNQGLTIFLKPPGCDQRGYLGPTEKDGCPTGGANGYIDNLVFSKETLSLGPPPCKLVYGCKAFDKDGLLGTLNFIFSAYLGAMIYEFYRLTPKNDWALLKKLLTTWIICLLVTSLGQISSVKRYFPTNQHLWSLGYVAVAFPSACAIYMSMKQLVSQKKWLGWPFHAVGKNALFILFAERMLRDRFPFGFKNQGSSFLGTLSGLIACSLWVLIAIFLHKYKFYIKY